MKTVVQYGEKIVFNYKLQTRENILLHKKAYQTKGKLLTRAESYGLINQTDEAEIKLHSASTESSGS